MIKTSFYVVILFFIIHDAWSQRVPRPGGGGEDIEVHGEKNTRSGLDSFYKIFKQQLTKCDPKKKIKIDFDHIYHYLFQKHFESMMKAKQLEKRPHEFCHSEKNDTIDCILNKKLKQSLESLIKNNYVEDHFKRQKDLSKREIQDRIDFLKHLTEK